MEEGFIEYVNEMERLGAHQAGLAKIIPPPEWQPRAAGYEMDSIGNIQITRHKQQQFVVQYWDGVYQLDHKFIETPMTFNAFKTLCELNTF